MICASLLSWGLPHRLALHPKMFFPVDTRMSAGSSFKSVVSRQGRLDSCRALASQTTLWAVPAPEEELGLVKRGGFDPSNSLGDGSAGWVVWYEVGIRAPGVCGYARGGGSRALRVELSSGRPADRERLATPLCLAKA